MNELKPCPFCGSDAMISANPEAQRVAIAEACGWRLIPSHDQPGGENYGTLVAVPESWTKEGETIWELPDYLNDLNAMHEVEGRLSPTLIETYHTWVNFVVVRDSPNVEPQHLPFTLARYRWHATAAQRAEAFLRTIGKWVKS